MAQTYDLLAIGAGPAGCAAAITAAAGGATVCLIDRATPPGQRPGETLHPGAVPLLERLGIGGAIAAGRFVRVPGIAMVTEAGCRFEAYGADNSGPWCGVQVPGATLDALLRRRAAELGVDVRLGEAAVRPIVAGHRVIGACTGRGTIRARFVVDGTGGRHWLARRLSLPIHRLSPPLIAHYGYAHTDDGTACPVPLFETDAGGWTWSAQVTDSLLHWTRLNLHEGPPAHRWRPRRWRRLAPAGPVRRADVTWRRSADVAGIGYFLCGDAAAVMDPAASHGVLKALMSGMLAGHLVVMICRQPAREVQARADFAAWMNERARADTDAMRELYADFKHPPQWLAAA